MKLRNHNFLMITYGFPPEGGANSIRAVKFAKYLPKFGWNPVILTATLQKGAHLDYSLLRDIPAGTPVKRAHQIPYFRGYSLLNRWLPVPGLLSLWIFTTFKLGILLIRRHKCKVIWATSPPPASLILGYFLKKATSLPLILDFRDQWTNNPYISYPISLLRSFSWILEKVVVRCADKIIVISEEMKREALVHWVGNVTSEKVKVIPNGYDPEDFVEPVHKEVNTKKVVRYVGSIYGHRETAARDFISILREISKINSDFPPISFEFVGNISRAVISDINLFNNSPSSIEIRHIPPVSHSKAISLMKSADILLLFVGKHQQADVETSAKIYEYLAAHRPVLIIGGSKSIGKLIKGFNHCQMISQLSPSELISAINRLLTCDNLLTINSITDFCAKIPFSRVDAALNLAKVLEQVAPSCDTDLGKFRKKS